MNKLEKPLPSKETNWKIFMANEENWGVGLTQDNQTATNRV